MPGFRPSFYNKDAKLHSIEILAWADDQDCFTLADAREHFSQQLALYGNADHEISERLRKLRKSGMIMVIESFKVIAGCGWVHGPRAAEIEARIKTLAEPTPGQRGRRPRLYTITLTGTKYVKTRKGDLKRILEKD